MYRTGEEIEYGNGIRATVVCVPSEGTHCACGGFIIYQAGAGYALCWMDQETEEDVWWFADETAPWLATLDDALARYDEGLAA